jgi:hypothetical protein
MQESDHVSRIRQNLRWNVGNFPSVASLISEERSSFTGILIASRFQSASLFPRR